MHARWESFKKIVALWQELFKKDKLLTYASAIAVHTLISAVSFVLLGVGLLDATGDKELWNRTIGPAIRLRVLPEVYRGIDAVVQHVFATSSTGLIVFAAALSIWKVSSVVRAVIDALNVIYGTKEERGWKVRLPLSFAISAVFIAAMIGAIVLITFAFGFLVRRAPAAQRSTR